MTDKTILQSEYDALSERVAAKNKEFMAAQIELKQLVSILVDAADKERKALLQKRVELLNLVGALDDELKVLTHRRDVAHMAIFEYAQAQSQEKANDFEAKLTKARLALDALLNEQRIFQNKGGNNLTREEADHKNVELRTTIAKMQAENGLLKRDANQAGAALTRARNDVENLKKELENGLRF